jgi:hypothetical protein
MSGISARTFDLCFRALLFAWALAAYGMSHKDDLPDVVCDKKASKLMADLGFLTIMAGVGLLLYGVLALFAQGTAAHAVKAFSEVYLSAIAVVGFFVILPKVLSSADVWLIALVFLIDASKLPDLLVLWRIWHVAGPCDVSTFFIYFAVNFVGVPGVFKKPYAITQLETPRGPQEEQEDSDWSGSEDSDSSEEWAPRHSSQLCVSKDIFV